MAASPNLKIVPKAMVESVAEAKPGPNANLSKPRAVSRLKLASKRKAQLGLRIWMERVLEECDRAAAGFDADPVHDLRVALRRCRSLADGLMAIDPDDSWKDMKKAGKKIFQALGELRDMQVMEEWIEKLSESTALRDAPWNDGNVRGAGKTEVALASTNALPAENSGAARQPASSAALLAMNTTGETVYTDPVEVRLLDHVRRREAELKERAFRDLSQFDRKQWKQWSKSLPQRAARVRPGSAVYLHLALEKWTAAYDLHKQAMRARTQTSWHQLRIGIKRFRYTVENFLPKQHAQWGSDLKELQDLLGEVHDLDVLWATAVECGALGDVDSSERWRTKLTAERDKRLARYRQMMVGRESLWKVWRAELPSGPRLRAAAMSRLQMWAAYLDPNFAHSRRVAQLALLLYDGLKSAGLGSGKMAELEFDPREVLQAAALLHDVGKAKGAENHQKASYRMIRGMARPLGWSARELDLTAVVARYHRGGLPRPRAKVMQILELPDRRLATELAAVLRLANALDARAGGEVPALAVRYEHNLVTVLATGYSPLDRSAEDVAAARHLLETVLRRPVMVKAMRAAVGGRMPSPRTGRTSG